LVGGDYHALTQNKTLVAYVTKLGASKEAAEIIVDTLRTKFMLDVDVVDLGKQDTPDLAQYSNVVVGAGVRGGMIYGKVKRFLKNDLSGKKVAFFVSSSWAGTPGSHDNAKKTLVAKPLAKFPQINFVSTEAFGGRIRYFKKTMLDSTDPAKVEAWAIELGQKFTQ
jgi:menaquinone-dependent protoporphyrinogen IX oxidase